MINPNCTQDFEQNLFLSINLISPFPKALNSISPKRQLAIWIIFVLPA